MATLLTTEYLPIGDPSCDLAREQLARAGRRIRDGGLVVFPTETVYGLGGDATRAESARRIYAAKGRPSDNPLIIHIADPQDAEPYAVTCDTYDRLARAFMPGPLTVILPRKPTIPTETTGGLETVAVRCPSHPIARALIRAAGTPIAAPSANLSGKPSPTCARHVMDDMDGRVDIIIDGGDCEIGLESTIVAISGEDNVTLLRPGAITYDALCMVIGKVQIADAVTEQLKEGERVLSPGMKYRHYAPDSPVVLLDGAPDAVLQYLMHEQQRCRCAILCYDEELSALQTSGEPLLFPVGARDDLVTQAHTLFTLLRHADRALPDIIYAHLPPMDGLGLALYNRMIRAAAHTIKRV
ncbi:MAG: threonylcarbamoyl-AMP synthase [Clostridia bacterium]|nr:threonylcarbamoyl-AMP synthase [Clostridia bacterium]